LIFGNGARSPIVLGLVPLTSLNRSFLWMTELSNSQNVAVPLSTRTNRRLKRSPTAVRPGGDMPKKSASVPGLLRKGKNPKKKLLEKNQQRSELAPKSLPIRHHLAVWTVDLSHWFSTRQVDAQEGNVLQRSPTWRYRVLKTALRLRPRRALSSAPGQRRHAWLESPIRQEKTSVLSGEPSR
jgi:hypothetical protein